MKVKQITSDQFKVEQAVLNYAKICSAIDTTIKKGLNVLLAMVIMIKFKFEIQTD